LKAREIVESAEAEAAKVREDILNKVKAEIESEKEEIKKKKAKEIEDFEKRGKANIMKAVDFLYNEFIGMIGHA